MGQLCDERTSLKDTPTEIENAFSKSPTGLRPFYNRLLGQIHVRNRPDCILLLQWVAHAMKPLSLPELAVR